MKEIMWKIELFCKCMSYDFKNWVLKKRIEAAWAKAGVMQEELDRIKEQAKL